MPVLEESSFRRLIKRLKSQLTFLHTTFLNVNPESPNYVSHCMAVDKLLEKWYVDYQTSSEPYQNWSNIPAPLTADLIDDEFAQLGFEYTTLNLKLTMPCVSAPSTNGNQGGNNNNDNASAHGSAAEPPLCNQFKITLPKLTLPKFSGDSSKWCTFIEQFGALIDSNESVSPLIKFQYLLNSLDETSLGLISHLSLSEDNYQLALGLLHDRYADPIRHSMLLASKVLQIPKMGLNNFKELIKSVDVLNSTIRALTALNQPPCEEVIAVAFLLSRFETHLLDKFHEVSKRENPGVFPSVTNILNFLSDTVKHREAVFQISHQLSPSTSKPNYPRANKPAFISNTNLQSSSTSKTCSFCSASNHGILSCKGFKQNSVPMRISWISKQQLCKNCLSHNSSTPCKSSSTCNICNQFHHTLLHLPTGDPNSVNRYIPANPNVQGQNHFLSCEFCQLPRHTLPTCNKFIALTPNERIRRAKELNLCSRCLRQHEGACSSKALCLTCNLPHHTLLHLPSGSSDVPPASVNMPSLISTGSLKYTILMSTGFIKLSVSPTQSIVVRAVLDTAAACSFVSQHCTQLLRCPRRRVKCQVSGVGGAKAEPRGMCDLSISAMSDQVIRNHHPFVILNRISCNTPSQQISMQIRPLVAHLNLADPHFDMPSRVDVILGADLAAELLLGGNTTSLGKHLPHVVSTPLGHVLIGRAPTASLLDEDDVAGEFWNNEPLNLPNFPACITSVKQIDSVIESFWELDEPPGLNNLNLARKDIDCENYFLDTLQRLTNGRYQVRLPFLDETHSVLGNSFSKAMCRLKSLEAKFKRNPEFKAKYVEFMADYLDQGHMIPADGPKRYFIPHHGIFKTHGDTSKIRVVFDGSSPTSSGLSLNDLLYAGPKLQPYIADIVVQFRFTKIAFTCDIKQMFRQIQVNVHDLPYQCILWREDPNQPVKAYWLTTVTYGTRCAPYLALRTLKQLVHDDGVRFPLAAKAIASHTFVDDIVVGADSLNEAVLLRDEVIALADRGGFQLRKWESNSDHVLRSLPPDWSPSPASADQIKLVSILGLSWCTSSDTLSVTPPSKPLTQPSFTKRQVVSLIPQVFDPCGWWSPVILSAKILLQQLWAIKLGWDDPIPESFLGTGLNFIQSIHLIHQFPVPRHLNTDHSSSLVLHGFCDASSRAYCSIVYVSQNNVANSGRLIVAKSKVAPLKTVSIPRLELCATFMLSKLIDHMYTIFTQTFSNVAVYLWSDSTISLSWIKTEPCFLKTFVANRVAGVQSIKAPATWRYVPSSDNPADIASRGCDVTTLSNHALWWTGPAWLPFPEQWPELPDPPQWSEAELELKGAGSENLACCITSRSLSETQSTDMFKYISRWGVLIKVVKVILNWRAKFKKIGPPTHNRAVEAVVFYIQRNHFKQLSVEIASSKVIQGGIAALCPFLDDQGLIRVAGRLHNALSIRQKFPFLLPKRDRLVKLLIHHYHLFFDHAGPVFLQHHLSLNFWILSIRVAIRSVLHGCVQCFKAKPKHLNQLMGQLPPARVNVVTPFLNTGVDYAGPFTVKTSYTRKSSTYKVWLCLFICMATKAVHLELASGMSANSYIDVLKRFISRRGVPANIYSDCGTNFIGACNKLKAFWTSARREGRLLENINGFCEPLNIKFHFNSPAAPHQGGLWERAVRSVKYHLSRVLTNQTPSWDTLNSIIIFIEGILNSRPITPLSSNPGDLEALTPGHFLIGRPIHGIVEGETWSNWVTPSHYHWRQQVVKHLWERWRREYLLLLFPRSKWRSSSCPLSVNDLVLVDEPNTPPRTWPLGRIVELITGKDGLARAARVKTKLGIVVRPFVKLCKLPIQPEDDSQSHP